MRITNMIISVTGNFNYCFQGFYFSIFDKDDDGYIPVPEMREILQSLGDKMSDKELDEMMAAASSDREGFINYEGISTYLLSSGQIYKVFNIMTYHL